MLLRRKLALVAGALALSSPVLTACGFDVATDRVNNITVGTNVREGEVDILSAVLVSAQDGSGTLITSLANNSTEEPATLEDITGGEGASLTVENLEPIEIPPGSLVNLADPNADVHVTGDFQVGDFIELVLVFDNGERTSVELPVVPDSEEYDGLDTSGSSAS